MTLFFKILKLAVALILAVFTALLTGLILEELVTTLAPSLFRGTGRIIKVLVVFISMPLYFYLVESYFIRREKGRKQKVGR